MNARVKGSAADATPALDENQGVSGAESDAPEAQPEEAAGPPPLTAEQEAIEEVIRGWLYDRIYNGPIARDPTCWNALTDALPSLRDLIAARGG